MKLYDDNGQSKAVRALIHDHAGAACSLGAAITCFGYDLKELPVDTDPQLLKEMTRRIERMREHVKRLEQVIDTYYIRFQNDFNT